MYNPPAFKEDDLTRQHELIRTRPLGLLISAGPEGLQASSLPFQLIAEDKSLGRLCGHLSRGNSQWNTLDGVDVLVVFQGPNGYVTPSWYQTKAEHGKVVPTWNYVMVQVRGTLHVIDDHEWLRKHVTSLTNEHEASQPEPWHVTDAPSSFIDAQLTGIVGFEIEIGQIEGKWKASQNRSDADRTGVAFGFETRGDDAMSMLVKPRGAS